MTSPIYLDNHSTTPVDPRVLEAMLPYLKEQFGNSSSNTHEFGWRAQEALERSRQHVAEIIGASARDIVFTSGATESNNLAIIGSIRALNSSKRLHVVTSQIEHHAVLDPMKELESQGVEVTYLKPQSDGSFLPEQIEESIRKETVLVSLMAAQNEVGTIQPLDQIGKFLKEKKILFHTDAAQALGKIPIDVEKQGIDLLSISGHKIYAPKGIGCLFIRGRNPRVKISPLMTGGGQERGIRSGTVNIPGAVAMAKACEICKEEMSEENIRVKALRNLLWEGLSSRLDRLTLNGPSLEPASDQRLSGNLNISFNGVQGESLITGLRKIAVSSGSACTSQIPKPSYVLRALGVSPELAHASLRIGIGRFNKEEDIEKATNLICEHVENLRKITRSVGRY